MQEASIRGWVTKTCQRPQTTTIRRVGRTHNKIWPVLIALPVAAPPGPTEIRLHPIEHASSFRLSAPQSSIAIYKSSARPAISLQ